MAAYAAKLAEVKGVVAPVFARLDEAKARPQLIEQTRERIDNFREMVGAWNITHPQVRNARPRVPCA